MKIARILSLIVVLLAISACSIIPTKTYTGPKLPSEQVVYLSGGSNILSTINILGDNSEIRLISIDGIQGENGWTFGYHSRFDGSLNVALEPGEHICMVNFFDRADNLSTRSPQSKSFKFYFKKGGRYSLSYAREDGSWTPVLIDKNSTKRVYP